MTMPGSRVTRINVSCRAAGPAETRVHVTYRYTSLSEAGDRTIAAMTEDAFRTMIDGWDTAIRAWLVRGTPASP
jgi:hypothetical protein